MEVAPQTESHAPGRIATLLSGSGSVCSPKLLGRTWGARIGLRAPCLGVLEALALI